MQPSLADLNSFEILKFVLSNLIQAGQLRVIDPYGTTHVFGSEEDRSVSIQFHEDSACRKLLLNPNLALGEIYMDGELTIEEGHLRDFLDLLFENISKYQNFGSLWLKAFDGIDFYMRRMQQFNTLRKSRSNISHHYDLPSEFYHSFLDPHRQYSCAYFKTDSDSLETAQENKMNHILSKLHIEPHHHVLDIGSGWGGLACFIAQKTGARVTGITLSKEQFQFSQELVQKLGLADQVRFKLRDYRSEFRAYDRVVSVGMFEHVGINHYGEFFKKLKSLLGEKGIALLHSIGRFSGPAATNPWIRKYIFPGGYIPSLSEVIPHVEKSGLFLTDLEILRLHYAKTLQHWMQGFEKGRETAQRKFGERFCRMWEFYLASSEASFKHFGNMVFQMQMAGELETVPLTRDYLYSDVMI